MLQKRNFVVGGSTCLSSSLSSCQTHIFDLKMWCPVFLAFLFIYHHIFKLTAFKFNSSLILGPESSLRTVLMNSDWNVKAPSHPWHSLVRLSINLSKDSINLQLMNDGQSHDEEVSGMLTFLPCQLSIS